MSQYRGSVSIFHSETIGGQIMMTDDKKKDLQRIAAELRKKAEPSGPLHAAWPIIFDIESFLLDRPTIHSQTADGLIDLGEQLLKKETQ